MEIGDLVKITDVRPTDEGNGSNPTWALPMDNCLGKLGRICTVFEEMFGVKVIGDNTVWFYSPHWLTKIVENKLKTNKQLLLI